MNPQPPFLATLSHSPSPTNHAATLLVNELNSISTLERNTIMERIHGVADVHIPPETQELIESKLRELDQTLQRISTKHAYNIALSQGRSYIHSRRFRLQFLRADGFDATKAANRMILYCEEKFRRFGKRTLSQPLVWQDLSADARALLARSGVLQLLASRDRAGRAILFWYLDASTCTNKNDKYEALSDASFYLLNAVSDDEETQKKGIITVTVIGNVATSEDAQSVQELIAKCGPWNVNSSPLKIYANHMWPSKLNTMSLDVIGSLSVSMGTEFRLRSKIHSTTFENAKRAMKTFGIPTEHLPLSMDGCELRMAFHQKWIRYRPQKEEEMNQNPTNFRGIDLPSCEDVCLQRGTSFHLLPGNLTMKALMEPLIDEYKNSASGRRRELNDIVIQAIYDTGGRFLSRSEGGWFEEILNHEEVNKSVGASFRSLLARTKRRTTNTPIPSIAKPPSPPRTSLELTSETTSSGTNLNPNDTEMPSSKRFRRMQVSDTTSQQSGGRSNSTDGSCQLWSV